MARKKKEETVQEEAVITAMEEVKEKTDEKKPVRRGRKPVTKKKEEPVQTEKTEEKKETETKKEPSVESPTGTPFEPERTEEKKPKKGRKPVKKEEKQVEKVPETVVEEEKKTAETEKKSLTNAQKNDAIRSIIKDLLAVRAYKWVELLDESSKLYLEKVDDKDAQSANDVRGRIGSVFDGMKKAAEVTFANGTYSLKGEEKEIISIEEKQEVQEEKTEEKAVEEKIELPVEEKKLPAIKPEAKLAPVFDMSLLLGAKEEKKGGVVEKKTVPVEEKKEEKVEVKEVKPASIKTEPKEKPAPKAKIEVKKEELKKKTPVKTEKKTVKTTDQKLKESFLKKIRSLGGSYFEYYSVYLLERYSLRNGRRIDALRVSGGDKDGGIDGEIEVTDRIGFKETIYIQAKNWNPIYGKEESWVIGETMLQQFIGAVAYRQAKEGKQHTRGIFVTTSYFTAGAKEMLEEMSDKFVGYDGDDLFEAAKECSFGLIQKDGVWSLDEKLLSGDKAFFNLY